MKSSNSNPPSAPRNVAPSPSAQSGSNGLIEWSANNSAIADGLKCKADQRFKKQGTTAPGTPTELSQPSADAEDAELKSSPPDEELEFQSTKRATKCRAFAQCSIRFQWIDRVERKQLGTADGLKCKADQRFKTGHHCSWHSDRVEVHRARMQRMQSSSRVPRMKSSNQFTKRATKCRAFAQCSIRFQWTEEWGANSSESQTGSSTDRVSRLRPMLNRVPKGRWEKWGTSGSAAQTGSGAHTSGKAFKVPNGQHANVGSDIVAPDTQTELSPSSAPPEQSYYATRVQGPRYHRQTDAKDESLCR